jgi:tight adherence protein C
MTRIVVVFLALGFVGLVLVLAEVPALSRDRLADRLRPHTPGGPAHRTRSGVLSVASFREVMGPVARDLGARMAALFGIDEDLAVRLERVHANEDPTSFRLRQLGWTVAALVGGVIAAALPTVPKPAAGLLVVGGPVLAFLVVEQGLAKRSTAYQRALAAELPVVTEQLGMLLGAGYSLGSALPRIAQRGGGVCSADLVRVMTRVRTGLSEIDALREWAAVARVESLERLVSVMALHREATDLTRLLSEEAKSMRRDAQRARIESIERRSQQVWIPVTVATLVPGVIFMAVPFIDALSLFSAGR